MCLWCRLHLSWVYSLPYKMPHISNIGSHTSTIHLVKGHGRRTCKKCGKIQEKRANGYGGSEWVTVTSN